MVANSSVLFKRGEGRDLGLALQSWHSSGGDPIYALGSTLYSEAVTVPYSPEAAQLVRGALTNLRCEMNDQHRRGAELALSYPDRAGYHFGLRNELAVLVERVEARFAELLSLYPEKED